MKNKRIELDEEGVINVISSAKKIAIFAHVNPDLDAYGSMFGAKLLCEKLGKEAEIFAFNFKKSFMNDIFDTSKVKNDFKPENFDLILMVDCNDFSRIDYRFREKVQSFKNILVIDHHEQSVVEDGLKFYIKKDECSASILVANLFFKFNLPLDKTYAEYLFAGIVGDTARFLNSNVNVDTFKSVLKLMKYNIDLQKIYDAVYRSITLKQINVKTYLLSHFNVIGKNVCYIIVTQKNLKKLGATTEDVKMFVNDLNNIKDFNVVMIAYQLEKSKYKVTCRSKNGYTVSEIATKYGGGGHKVAAGFNLFGTKFEVKRKLKRICLEF